MAEANRVNARPWFRNRELWFLVGVLVVSLTLRARLVSIDRIVRWDEPDYLTLGRHLITGQGYSVSGRVDVHYPPLFPLVTGLLYPLTHDMKLNSDICFVVFGALFLLPLYWLTKQLFGARVAAMTTLLVCIYPPLTSSVLFWGTMIEPLYLFLLFTAFCAAWLAWERQTPASYALVGGLFGLTYLVKPEALVYLGWFLALLALGQVWRRKLLCSRTLLGLVSAIAVFALVISPYILFLYKETGRILITGKLGVTYVAGEGAVVHDPGLYDRALARLDSAGEEIIWFSPDRFKYDLWQIIRANPRAFLVRTWRNVNALEALLFVRRVFPFYLLIPVALGVLGQPWAKERLVKELFLLATIPPVLVFMPFHIELRYFAALLPVLIIWVAKGIDALAWWATQTWQKLRPSSRSAASVGRTSAIVLCGLLLVYFAVLQPSVVADGLAEQNPSRREAGLWLNEHSSPDAMIMSRDTEVAFYADRRWAATPNEEYARFIEYVRHRGANYVIVDEREITVIRPQLKLLLNEESPPQELRHVYTALDPRGRTIVYEVLP